MISEKQPKPVRRKPPRRPRRQDTGTGWRKPVRVAIGGRKRE